MNNYHEIALEAIKNITKTEDPQRFAELNQTLYFCTKEAVRLQALKYNEEIGKSYIKSLEEYENRNS